MKKLGDLLLIVGLISIIVGIISRLTMVPIRGILAGAFLEFAGVCALFAIALFLREK